LHRPTAFTVYVRRLQVRIGTCRLRKFSSRSHIVCSSTLSGHWRAFQLRLFRGILSILRPIRPGKWRNLELQIGRRFRGRVLRVHPFGLSLRSFCLTRTLSQALMHRTPFHSPERTERSSRKS
jgi:hypothetical protein